MIAHVQCCNVLSRITNAVAAATSRASTALPQGLNSGVALGSAAALASKRTWIAPSSGPWLRAPGARPGFEPHIQVFTSNAVPCSNPPSACEAALVQQTPPAPGTKEGRHTCIITVTGFGAPWTPFLDVSARAKSHSYMLLLSKGRPQHPSMLYCRKVAHAKFHSRMRRHIAPCGHRFQAQSGRHGPSMQCVMVGRACMV